jgi:phage portal protein BeeE
MTRKTFLHRTVQSAVLTGEAYWLLCQPGGTKSTIPQAGVDAPFELWPVTKPDRIIPVPDAAGYLIGYLYNNGIERIPLPKEAVVPVGFVPDPDDLYHGFGPVQSMMADLDSERYAALMQRNSMQNGGQPGGVIEFDTKLTQPDWDEFQMRWREQHQGISNVNRVAILERAHWVDAKLTNRDLQFEALRKMNRDLVFAPFGMHGAIMGVSENVNKANAEAAEITFSRWIVRPKLEEIKEALNERVLPFIDSMLTMDYTDPTPNDLSVNTNVAVAFYLSGLRTRNDALAMGGFEPIDGPQGDEYVQPAPTPLAAPPHVPSPSGRSFDDAVTKWPAGIVGHEHGMQTAWRQRLATVGTDAIDYLSRNGH